MVPRLPLLVNNSQDTRVFSIQDQKMPKVKIADVNLEVAQRIRMEHFDTNPVTERNAIDNNHRDFQSPKS